MQFIKKRYSAKTLEPSNNNSVVNYDNWNDEFLQTHGANRFQRIRIFRNQYLKVDNPYNVEPQDLEPSNFYYNTEYLAPGEQGEDVTGYYGEMRFTAPKNGWINCSFPSSGIFQHFANPEAEGIYLKRCRYGVFSSKGAFVTVQPYYGDYGDLNYSIHDQMLNGFSYFPCSFGDIIKFQWYYVLHNMADHVSRPPVEGYSAHDVFLGDNIWKRCQLDMTLYYFE